MSWKATLLGCWGRWVGGWVRMSEYWHDGASGRPSESWNHKTFVMTMSSFLSSSKPLLYHLVRYQALAEPYPSCNARPNVKDLRKVLSFTRQGSNEYSFIHLSKNSTCKLLLHIHPCTGCLVTSMDFLRVFGIFDGFHVFPHRYWPGVHYHRPREVPAGSARAFCSGGNQNATLDAPLSCSSSLLSKALIDE